MRLSQWIVIAGLSLSVACKTESVEDDDDVSDTSDTDDTDVGPSLLDVVAVGFELEAIHLSDDSLTGYNLEYEGNQYFIPPGITLTFSDAEFFGLASAEQEGHFCIAYGDFQVDPMETPFPTEDNATLFVAYEGTLNITYNNCEDLGVVSGDWGADATAMIDKFNGMRIGIGFGPVTEYLIEPFDETDPDIAEYLADYGPAMMAEYIAINDKNDGFIGRDWTLSYLFEWDAEAIALKGDAEGLLIPIDISGVTPGETIPEGYIRSNAFWYEDFPHYSGASNIDFDKLK